MSATDHLEKNIELKDLFHKIYLSNRDFTISDISRYIEVVIKMTDENLIDKVEAGYIITNVLLGYDDNDVYEKVFDISSQLEIAKAKVNNWSDDEIIKEWNDLKSIFFNIKSSIENRQS